MLWETDDRACSDSLKIHVRSIAQGICGLREIYKVVSEQLEKRRTEILKIKNDLHGIGRELEQ